jgi:hypothetical protein
MPLDDNLPVARDVVRHCLATLAYRAAKVLRDVPPDFPHFSIGDEARCPLRIVAHLADLMAWGVTMTEETIRWVPEGGGDWNVEIARFFDGLKMLDDRLAIAVPPADRLEKVIQGPVADALWHVGQLAMLRGIAGAPVRPESYARAQIVAGRVGRDQRPPVAEFDGDASAKA